MLLATFESPSWVLLFTLPAPVHGNLPSWANPMISCTMPVIKHNRMANSGPISCMFSRVMMAIMAVGPMAGSLQLPNTVYTKHAMNEEYRPIWKQRKICLIKPFTVAAIHFWLRDNYYSTVVFCFIVCVLVIVFDSYFFWPRRLGIDRITGLELATQRCTNIGKMYVYNNTCQPHLTIMTIMKLNIHHTF